MHIWMIPCRNIAQFRFNRGRFKCNKRAQRGFLTINDAWTLKNIWIFDLGISCSLRGKNKYKSNQILRKNMSIHQNNLVNRTEIPKIVPFSTADMEIARKVLKFPWNYHFLLTPRRVFCNIIQRWCKKV